MPSALLDNAEACCRYARTCMVALPGDAGRARSLDDEHERAYAGGVHGHAYLVRLFRSAPKVRADKVDDLNSTAVQDEGRLPARAGMNPSLSPTTPRPVRPPCTRRDEPFPHLYLRLPAESALHAQG
jgi:hypothetical protein